MLDQYDETRDLGVKTSFKVWAPINLFAPFDQHPSTEKYYTSDYDLSKFNATQLGFGISYTDIFTKAHIWKFGLKSIDLKYNNYKRNTGLSANFIGVGFKFLQDQLKILNCL